MGFFSDLKRVTSARKVAVLKAEERLYEFIRDELESGAVSRGIWTKAEISAKSLDEPEIRKKYIQLRYEQLRAEEKLFQQLVDDILRAAEENTQDQQAKTVEPPKEDSFVQPENPNIECPFCQTVNKGYGRCTKCGNTVDQWVLQAHRT